MTNSRVFRISGLALLAGAIVFVVHIVLRSVITAGLDPAAFAKEDLWVSVNALGIMGAFLVILGLPAMYARMAGSAGLSGLIGVALLAMAWMFFGLFLSLYSTLVLPWLADKGPSLIAASTPPPPAFMIGFVIGLLAWLVGTVLLAIPFIRRRVQPSWVGYLLAASGVWVVIGNVFIAPSGPASNLAVNLLSNMGPVLLMVGLGYLGYCLWSEHAAGSGHSHGTQSA